MSSILKNLWSRYFYTFIRFYIPFISSKKQHQIVINYYNKKFVKKIIKFTNICGSKTYTAIGHKCYYNADVQNKTMLRNKAVLWLYKNEDRITYSIIDKTLTINYYTNTRNTTKRLIHSRETFRVKEPYILSDAEAIIWKIKNE